MLFSLFVTSISLPGFRVNSDRSIVMFYYSLSSGKPDWSDVLFGLQLSVLFYGGDPVEAMAFDVAAGAAQCLEYAIYIGIL